MQISKDRIAIGSTITDTPIELVTYRVAAPAKGRKVYIQSGIHGGEITHWTQHRLFNFLKENLQAGEVVFVPIANPASWEQRAYFYTFGKFSLYDGRDFNYHFPGKADGSLNQRIARELYKLAEGSDLALDLHTARNSIPFGIYSRDAYQDIIRDLGLTYNFQDQGEKAEIELMDQLDANNIPNVCVECGSHDEYDVDKNEQVFQGILRVLAKMGLIDKRHTTTADGPVYSFQSDRKIIAQESGFIRYDAGLGVPFKKGESLFTLYRATALGEEYRETASEDGVAYKRAPTHIYRIGDDTLHYVPMDNLKRL